MAGKRYGISSAALALGLLGLTGGCDRWWQTPPTPKSPIPFPTGDFTISTSFDSGDGATPSRTHDLSDQLIGSEAGPNRATATELLSNIRTCLPPSRTIEIVDDRLTAELTEQEHSELARMLDDWRSGGARQIVVEARFLAPDLSLVNPIAWNPVAIDGNGPGGLPVFGARITEAQLVQLLRDVQGETRSNVMQAPKVTLFNGQNVTFADIVARPFVTSVNLAKNGAFQPVVETVEEGTKIALRPSTNGDGQIELAVELTAAEIGEVAEVNLPFRHPGDPLAPVTVQAPAVTATSAKAVVRLAADESFLICIPGSPDVKNPQAPTLANFFVFTPYLLEDDRSSAAVASTAVSR